MGRCKVNKLTIWTTQIERAHLPKVLNQVHSLTPFHYLMADWWNAPGLLAEYEEGIAELARHPEDSVSGSAFGEQAEVQWRQIGNQFWLVVVAEADLSRLAKVADINWREEVEEVKRWEGPPRERTLLLWGTKWFPEQGIWIEARIPRPLRYPVAPEAGKSDAVFVDVIEYLDRRGRVIALRRHRLRAQFKREEVSDE
jgi:hypothetical protein